MKDVEKLSNIELLNEMENVMAELNTNLMIDRNKYENYKEALKNEIESRMKYSKPLNGFLEDWNGE